MISSACVTGASGFLGAALVRRLADEGIEVRLLARPSSDLSAVDMVASVVVRGELDDPGAAAEAIAGCDALFHVAARNDLGSPDPGEMRRVNVGATRCLLETAAAEGAVAVYCSSVSALGPTGTEARDETYWAPAVPAVAYAATKREAHVLARNLASEGAPIRIASPGYIYGPGDNTPFAAIMGRLVKGVPVGYMPETVNSFVHVDDCADALFRVAVHADDADEFVVVSDCVTFREFFEVLAESAGRRPPLLWVSGRMMQAAKRFGAPFAAFTGVSRHYLEDSVAMAVTNWAFTGDKLRKDLDWSPRTLPEGLTEVVQWLRHS